MQLDALIFDLDGTLADSLADIGHAMNEVLVGLGLPAHAVSSYKAFVGEGAENLVRRAVAAAGAAELPRPIGELLQAYRASYAQREHASSTPYPGIEAMLEGVVARGRKMAVLSNKHDDQTRHLVAQAFGRFPFVEVRGEREGVPRKPDPTAALELAAALGVPPARIGFVGDTAIDVRTARAAGMVPIGVLWGFRSHDELASAGAQHFLSRPEDLLGLLR